MFKQHFHFLLFLFGFLALSSCRTMRQATQKSDTKTEMVIERKTFYKDTVFYTKPAETSLAIPLNAFRKCPEDSLRSDLKSISTDREKPKTYSQKNGNATVTVKYIHDTIQVTAECDSIALDAKIRSEYEGKFQNSQSVSEKSEKAKTGLGFFDVVWWILGSLIIGFVVGFIVKSLIKITI